VDIYFGPKPPASQESSWLYTQPDMAATAGPRRGKSGPTGTRIRHCVSSGTKRRISTTSGYSLVALGVQAAFTGRRLKTQPMPVSRLLPAMLLLGVIATGATPALAADSPHRACLNKAEQRAAVASHRAIRLAQAIKSARRHGRHGELLRARLCHRGDRLVYVLTLLARSGKVIRTSVDAANGELMNGR